MMTLLQCDGMDSWVHECSVCIPGQVANLIKMAYTAILIAVPLLLIITGMITLASSIMKQKEEDIKKAQQLLVKKMIAGAIVFFLFVLVRWLIVYFDGDLANCFDALINYNSTEHGCVKNADGSISGNANCSASSNNDFWDFNNQCIANGTDGAAMLYESSYKFCYIKDYENCCCDEGTPFKAPLEENIKNKCMCAVSKVIDGRNIVITQPGKEANQCY